MVAKALLLIARYFRRIAVALEGLLALYTADCQARDVYVFEGKHSKDDEVVVTYSSKPEEFEGDFNL